MTSTCISKEEIAKISATEQSQYTRDENARVIDRGPVDFELGVVHRQSTRTPLPARAGGNAGAGAAQSQPCGREMASLPPGGQKGGLTHDYQSEGYYITSGGGTPRSRARASQKRAPRSAI